MRPRSGRAVVRWWACVGAPFGCKKAASGRSAYFGVVRVGALLLCRDVSELRRRERELSSKDAAIRETHHRVKNSLLSLYYRAQEVGACVACFGHTHSAMARWEGGILLLNPGSLRDGRYAVLEIGEQGEVKAELA